ncbi:MAG: aspartyl protease family protein [Candidatus Eremiobacteraeota bacterium]|nr:aspartyl protease family protein [Candidatus Eremiobacteraeota bacterium]
MATLRKTALATLGVREPKTVEISGAIQTAHIDGTFHIWRQGEKERFDENLGVRRETTLRVGDREYIRSATGQVRQLHGLLVERQKTADFIGSDEFLRSPQYATVVGNEQLPAARNVTHIRVSPPGGQAEDVYVDAKDGMIDRVAFDDVDGITTIDYSDYKTIGGVLVAMKEVTSNGDHEYDLVQTATRVKIDKALENSVFDVPASSTVAVNGSVTVPIEERNGHLFTQVSVHGKSLRFLIDTGAQGVVLDGKVALQLGLMPEGRLQVTGAQRTGGLGMAPLDAVQIGGATLPTGIVSVLDLSEQNTGLENVDGILGFPFFASADVKIDPNRLTMTIAKPGGLVKDGTPIPVDIDRELVEIEGKINGIEGRFVIDTGNSIELLVFRPFLDRHNGLVPMNNAGFAPNYGVGGSARAMTSIVDELDFGSYRLYNRYANVMLATSGAFADRFDAGNIGYATLRNFVITYDIANGTIYAQRSSTFDDGRYRPRPQ